MQVLELACARESDKVFDAGGLPAIMSMLIEHDKYLHRDTLQSCMNVVTRLIPRMEPKDPSMDSCISSLSILLSNEDAQLSEPAMKCFVGLADRFIRRGKDPAPIVENGLIEELIRRLAQVGQSSASGGQGGGGSAPPEKPSGHSVATIINLLSTLCRGSPNITHVSCGRKWLEGLVGSYCIQLLSLLVFIQDVLPIRAYQNHSLIIVWER